MKLFETMNQHGHERVAFHVDPATVATAAEVSVLNDMMIDDP